MQVSEAYKRLTDPSYGRDEDDGEGDGFGFGNGDFGDGDLSEEEMMAAVVNGKVVKGDVVVIRYEGPKGGPGMPEMCKFGRSNVALAVNSQIHIPNNV